jgi:hypothetical protein
MTTLRFAPRLALVAAAAALAACETTPQPFAIPDGRYYRKTELNRFPVVITKIDGESNIQKAPLIEPGMHTLSLVSLGPRLGRLPREETLRLDMKPCMRYILAAQHPNAIEERFTPVVDESYREGGCREGPQSVEAAK